MRGGGLPFHVVDSLGLVKGNDIAAIHKLCLDNDNDYMYCYLN